jgi:hypothetical protein
MSGLDRRFDDLESGRVQPIGGEEAYRPCGRVCTGRPGEFIEEEEMDARPERMLPS